MTSGEIISFLVNSLSFKQDENEHNSFYKECPIGGNELVVVRISNHRTYLQTWADRYKPTILPNKKVVRRMGKNLSMVNRTKYFYSFVFEDEQNTVGNNSVKSGRKIKVLESVNKSAQFTIDMLNGFAAALQQLCSSNQYNSAALGDYETVTTMASDSITNNNNNIKS